MYLTAFKMEQKIPSKVYIITVFSHSAAPTSWDTSGEKTIVGMIRHNYLYLIVLELLRQID